MKELEHIYEHEPVPERNRERTPECPPLFRFFTAVRDGWTPEERQHVSGCPYCQKTTAQMWMEMQPSLAQLAQYVLSPESHPDRAAMERYLARQGGRLPRLVTRLLETRGLLEASADRAVLTLGFARVAFGTLPAPSASLASAAGATDARVLMESDDPRSHVRFGLRISAQDELEVFLLGAGELARRHVLTLHGGPEPLSVGITTFGSGESSISLGPAEALLAELGPDCLVVLEDLPA